ncbi:MAG: biopolymer transporter ExbD [Treponema sp.]|nr:biopolymer transporter ExbD [Treponema sp.]
MKIKRAKKSSILETCAASDLAFLLIIYFLVIAGFNINMGFLMNLPARDSTRTILSEDLLRFEMTNTGDILHAGEILDIRNAGAVILSAQTYNPNVAVSIMIDRQARWQNVVSFVELAQDLNIEAFSFSMKED